MFFAFVRVWCCVDNTLSPADCVSVMMMSEGTNMCSTACLPVCLSVCPPSDVCPPHPPPHPPSSPSVGAVAINATAARRSQYHYAAREEGEGEEGDHLYSRSLAFVPASPALPAPFR